MRGSRRIYGKAGLAGIAAALALLLAPGVAPAALPPACNTSIYPKPWLLIDGSLSANFTRYLQMVKNPKASTNPSGNDDADIEYPFTLHVDKSNGVSRNFTVHDYARDQFPVFFGRGQTANARATYVEVHTDYDAILGFRTVTRCSRTVTAHFKRPKNARPGGGEIEDGQGEDTQGQSEDDD